MSFVPAGMTRRHFMSHMAASAATIPAIQFMQHLQVHAETVKKNQKACILMWMGGGPPTIDIWDLKPGSKNGGEFKPITAAGTQISEHMPKTAAQFDVLNVVRLDEHPRSRSRPRSLLHAHRICADSDRRTPDVWLSGQSRTWIEAKGIGNSFVCLDRR